MEAVLRRRLLPVIGIVALSAAIPGVLLRDVGRVMVMIPMSLHFFVVGIAGLAAFGAALTLTVVGARRRDGRAVLVGTAFSGMAAMLFVHALATPGVLVGDNGLVQLAGAGNLPAGAAVLALAAAPRFRRPESVRPFLWLQGAWVAAVAAVGAAGLLDTGLIPVLPGPGGPSARAVFAVSCVLLAILAYRAGRTFLLTRRLGDLSVVVGIAWLGGGLAGLLFYGMMDLGFWIAHVFEVAGIVLVGLPAAVDLYRDTQSNPLAGDFSAAQLVAKEEAFFGARVHALMLRLVEKDPYTEVHTRRVALLAVQLGEQLGLAPARLRRLAIGGLLHDMGKLSVPDEILGKPGALDEEEFAVIRRHPVWGDELLAELGGFDEEVRRLVRDHHERLDGKGYPNGAGADELGLETRILTVCDVYDALTSKRVYRDAWPHERALALLREETGTAFDPDCVAALERLLAAPAAERAPMPAFRPAPAT